jgi:chromosome partitioning protein
VGTIFPVIYGFLNQKGGVGKTTLSINHAMELARRRRRVLLIDGDPQESAMDWARTRAEAQLPLSINVVHYAQETLHRDIAGHVDHYDDIVVDGAGKIDSLTRSAMLAVDMVVIPIQASGLDAWAASDVLGLLADSVMYKPQLKSAFVITRKIHNALITEDVIAGLKDALPTLLNTQIGQRVHYVESITAGQSAYEYKPRSTAAREICDLTDELEKLWLAPAA